MYVKYLFKCVLKKLHTFYTVKRFILTTIILQLVYYTLLRLHTLYEEQKQIDATEWNLATKYCFTIPSKINGTMRSVPLYLL